MTARRLRAWGGCVLLACACLALDRQSNCSRTQYEAHGKCCRRCPPGERVREPCSQDSDTACAPCQARHFQDAWTKEATCTPHRYCDRNAGLVVRVPGSATQNAVCQCRGGTHCSGRECQSCQEHRACGPGEGVEQAATDVRDTVCAECPPGSFSNVTSAVASCQPWSSCEAAGLAHKADGTRFSDTVCEEAPKVRSGVLVPAALAAVAMALACVGLLLWHRRRRRQEHLKLRPLQDCRDPTRLDPEEDEDETSDALPIQETLPITPGGSKEACLAGQQQD